MVKATTKNYGWIREVSNRILKDRVVCTKHEAFLLLIHLIIVPNPLALRNDVQFPEQQRPRWEKKGGSNVETFNDLHS